MSCLYGGQGIVSVTIQRHYPSSLDQLLDTKKVHCNRLLKGTKKSSISFCEYLQNQDRSDVVLIRILKFLPKQEAVIELHPRSHMVDDESDLEHCHLLGNNSPLRWRILDVVGFRDPTAVASTYWREFHCVLRPCIFFTLLKGKGWDTQGRNRLIK